MADHSWCISDDTARWDKCILAPTARAAMDAAKAQLATLYTAYAGDDGARATIFVQVRVAHDDNCTADNACCAAPIGSPHDDGCAIYDEAVDTVGIDPPDESGCSHDWRSPHSVLGGDPGNPGVVGHGGGVIITEVCALCAQYKIVDTWASSGSEQGFSSISYRESDDDSRAWLVRLAVQTLLDSAQGDEHDRLRAAIERRYHGGITASEAGHIEPTEIDDELRAIKEDAEAARAVSR